MRHGTGTGTASSSHSVCLQLQNLPTLSDDLFSTTANLVIDMPASTAAAFASDGAPMHKPHQRLLLLAVWRAALLTLWHLPPWLLPCCTAVAPGMPVGIVRTNNVSYVQW